MCETLFKRLSIGVLNNSKKAELDKAKKALDKAKSLNKPVVYILPTESGWRKKIIKKKEMKK